MILTYDYEYKTQQQKYIECIKTFWYNPYKLYRRMKSIYISYKIEKELYTELANEILKESVNIGIVEGYYLLRSNTKEKI